MTKPHEPKIAPTVGRIVHYYSKPTGRRLDEPRAAMITRVVGDDGRVLLHVYPVHLGGDDAPHLAGPTDEVPYSEQPSAGCWSWPPRIG